MSSFGERIVGAVRLDPRLYEEVEADPGATGQAVAIVVLSSLAAGLGSVHRGGAAGILVGTLLALAGWYAWAYLTYLIGTKILPEPGTSATHAELLRTIGFSSSPGLIRILGVIPGISGVVFLGASVWMLVAMVIAVRQALDYESTVRAVGVCLIGWLIQSAVLVLFLLFYISRIP
jgi:hypothetical protein